MQLDMIGTAPEKKVAFIMDNVDAQLSLWTNKSGLYVGGEISDRCGCCDHASWNRYGYQP